MSCTEFGWAMEQEVGPVSKLALMFLGDNSHDFSVAFTVEWLAKKMHCSKKRARSSLRRLEKRGLIFINGQSRSEGSPEILYVRLKLPGVISVPAKAVLS